MCASVIHADCMNELTEDARRQIEQIHSSWIEFEVSGHVHSLMALCADDIELWPPDARPLIGRTAVLAQMEHGNGSAALSTFDVLERVSYGTAVVI